MFKSIFTTLLLIATISSIQAAEKRNYSMECFIRGDGFEDDETPIYFASDKVELTVMDKFYELEVKAKIKKTTFILTGTGFMDSNERDILVKTRLSIPEIGLSLFDYKRTSQTRSETGTGQEMEQGVLVTSGQRMIYDDVLQGLVLECSIKEK